MIIGISAGGGALFLVIIAFCLFRLHKSRNERFNSNNTLDDNPVYMYDYADPDENNEIYDTNAYYAASDVDANESTVATDLNPDYE